jgi:carbon-monoxide dehydrogenase small subunit
MTSPRLIRFTLNGAPERAMIEPHWTLIDLLQRFDLVGARESCAQGLCGCCTVLVDGTAVSGCLTLAAFVDGAALQTIEETGPNGEIDDVQEAFIEAGALQCGFCTPGFVLMTRQLLDANPSPDDEAIRHYLSGNLCRCGAYPEIIAAVKLAARKRAAASS